MSVLPRSLWLADHGHRRHHQLEAGKYFWGNIYGAISHAEKTTTHRDGLELPNLVDWLRYEGEFPHYSLTGIQCACDLVGPEGHSLVRNMLDLDQVQQELTGLKFSHLLRTEAEVSRKPPAIQQVVPPGGWTELPKNQVLFHAIAQLSHAGSP